MNKVFVLGSLNMDFIISVNRMPKLGETLQGHGFQSSPGGKGANQAVALAKQGIETYIIGSVGDDMIGDEIKKSLKYFNVKSDFLTTVQSQASGVACIILEQDDNRIITDAGANAIHDIDHIRHIIDKELNTNDVLLAQLEIPLDVIEKSFITAQSKGVKTVLNAAPIKNLSAEILKHTDMLIVNESEGESLLKSKINQKQMKYALDQLLKLGPKEVILTLGDKGSYYKSFIEYNEIPAYPVKKVVDTTGAGDAYIGCYLAEIIKGKKRCDALRMAAICGAMTIQKKGVHHAIPSPDMIKEYIESRSLF